MPTFTMDGKQIYYESYGRGRPLVLLNGIMMSCASWKPFIEALSANNHLLLVDFLDQGRSDKMVGQVYDHGIQVQVVRRLLEHLDLKNACIAGISYGSEVALEFAVTYPEMTERLILLNATAATGWWLGDIGKAWNLAAGSGEAYYHTSIPVIYSPAFYTERHEWMEKRKELLIPLFGNPDFIGAMQRLTDSSETYDLRDRLGEVQCPTLVVSCQEDYLTPLKEQEYLASHIKACHHVILPNCGHASMYEQPTLFASLIAGFAGLSHTKFDI